MRYYSYEGKPLNLSFGPSLSNKNNEKIRIANLAGDFIVVHFRATHGVNRTLLKRPKPRLIYQKDGKTLKYIGFWEEYSKSKEASLPRIYHTKSGDKYIAGEHIWAPKKITDKTCEILFSSLPDKSIGISFVIKLLSKEHLKEIQEMYELSCGYDDGSNDGINDEHRLYDERNNYVGYLMRCHYTETGERIIESKFVNSGGEGNIYTIDPSSSLKEGNLLAAKIYNDNIRADEEKLKTLQKLFNTKDRQNRINGLSHPKYLIYDKPRNGRCIGFLMTHYSRGITLFDLVKSNQNLKNGYWTRVELVKLAIEILKRFNAIHDKQILMGDVNLNNILVVENEKTHVANPIFIDVDSYQISNKEEHRCKVFREEFLSPKLQLQSDKNILLRTFNDEYYAIAVLLFNILFLGRHPYESSRNLIVEKQIRERKFLFPSGYELNKDSLKGAYLRIWWYLPDELRQAFHRTFYQADSNRQFLKPNDWLSLMTDYLAKLEKNVLPRTIYPSEQEHRYLLDSYVPKFKIRDVNFENEPELGQFINKINSDNKENYAVIELGATWMTLLIQNRYLNKAEMQIRNYVYSIKRDGSLDIDKFITLTSKYWDEFKRIAKGENPIITNLYIYGGSFLRNLPNRLEVIKVIKEKLELNIGVIPVEKEINIFVKQNSPLPRNKHTLFVYAGLTSLILAVRHNGQNTIYELGDLGTAVLQNCIFGTSVRNVTRLETQFEKIDSEINTKLQNVCLPKMDRIIFMVRDTKKYKGVLNLHSLEKEHNNLNCRLLHNRTFASDLYDDIEFNPMRLNESFSMLNNRLILSIYIGLIRELMPSEISESVCNYQGIIEDIVNV